MIKSLNIPDEFNDSFQNLIRLLPHKLQTDVDSRNLILVYLKLGGEKMAAHGIEVIKMRYRDEMRQEDEALSDSETIDAELEADEDFDEDDDLDDDLDDEEGDDDLDDDDLDGDDADDYTLDL